MSNKSKTRNRKVRATDSGMLSPISNVAEAMELVIHPQAGYQIPSPSQANVALEEAALDLEVAREVASAPGTRREMGRRKAALAEAEKAHGLAKAMVVLAAATALRQRVSDMEALAGEHEAKAGEAEFQAVRLTGVARAAQHMAVVSPLRSVRENQSAKVAAARDAAEAERVSAARHKADAAEAQRQATKAMEQLNELKSIAFKSLAKPEPKPKPKPKKIAQGLAPMRVSGKAAFAGWARVKPTPWDHIRSASDELDLAVAVADETIPHLKRMRADSPSVDGRRAAKRTMSRILTDVSSAKAKLIGALTSEKNPIRVLIGAERLAAHDEAKAKPLLGWAKDRLGLRISSAYPQPKFSMTVPAAPAFEAVGL